MEVVSLLVSAVACWLLGGCSETSALAVRDGQPAVASAVQLGPEKTGEALDVELTAKAAYVWDAESGATLYEKGIDEKRPVASLTKLASVLAVRSLLAPETIVEIPAEVRVPQRFGAHVRLPAGEHVSVQELLEASLVASANDAMVALAVAAKGSEEAFVAYTNEYLQAEGLANMRIANATGLTGGEQYATAMEVGQLLTRAYADSVLRPLLSAQVGTLQTQEGTVRRFETTNDLVGTYMPILAGKTGYTIEAGENLAILTEGAQGQPIGVVVLGSSQRFQDTKVLAEWVWRNYTWP